MPTSDATYRLFVVGDQVLGTDDFLELTEQFEQAVATYGRGRVEAQRNGQLFRPGPSRLVKRFSFEVPR